MNSSSTDTRQPRLAGTFDWDPYGESLLAIVEKIGAANVLFGGELFTVLRLRPPSRYLRRDPDTVDGAQCAYIEQLAGWPPSTLSASLPKTYLPPETGPTPNHRVLATRAPSVRFCADCAECGIHLALFQVAEFQRCPLHDSGLTDRCPCCSELLRPYEFAPRTHETISCRRCDWGCSLSEPTGRDDALDSAKRTVVTDLVGWLSTLREAFGPNDSSIHVLSTPGRVRPLTLYNALIEGPEWMGRCLHAGSRTRRRTIPLGASAAPTPRRCESSAAGRQTELDDRVQAVMVDRACWVERDLSQTFELTNLKDGAFLSSTGYCRRLVDDEASIAALAFRWWRRFLAPFPLQHVPLERCAPAWTSRGSVPFLTLWDEVSVGPRETLQRSIGSEDQICELASLWTDVFLRALFLALVGRASLFSFGPVQQLDILGAAEEASAMPLIVLRARLDRLDIVEVTNVAPEREFVALFRSGYTGFEEGRLSERSGADPIHELAAFPAPERQRSNENLRQLAGGAWSQSVTENILRNESPSTGDGESANAGSSFAGASSTEG